MPLTYYLTFIFEIYPICIIRFEIFWNVSSSTSLRGWFFATPPQHPNWSHRYPHQGTTINVCKNIVKNPHFDDMVYLMWLFFTKMALYQLSNSYYYVFPLSVVTNDVFGVFFMHYSVYVSSLSNNFQKTKLNLLQSCLFTEVVLHKIIYSQFWRQ